MDIKNFTSAIAQIAEEKGIAVEKIIETIEMAIAAAYKKDYGKRGQIIRAKLNPETGGLQFWQIKEVVAKDMVYSEEDKEEKTVSKKSEASGDEPGRIRFNPEKHIMLEEAKKIKSGIKAGEEMETILTPQKDYGRIAAQTAKQVILQRIREVEKETIFSEYKSKEGEIISGIVQRVEGRNVFIDLGKMLGILAKEEQVPGEFYRPGQRLKVFILKVEETTRGAAIFLSRAYPKLISKLFELEVPEISSDQIEIKSIAREPGSRSKIAVSTEAEGVDPIGSMIGQRGTRVMAVINELGGEKIDIVEYSDEAEQYIANSLLPAKTLEVKILPKNKALAIVPEDQLSLAIGKNGQNVRLAAKLTGWKIDVKPESAEEEINQISEEQEAEEKTKTKKKKTEKTKSKKASDQPAKD